MTKWILILFAATTGFAVAAFDKMDVVERRERHRADYKLIESKLHPFAMIGGCQLYDQHGVCVSMQTGAKD
jgi:hypothetical protein